jgi:hypothetical protein
MNEERLEKMLVVSVGKYGFIESGVEWAMIFTYILK